MLLDFLIILVVIFSLSLILNLLRRRLKSDFQLKENILLTRNPILFIPGEQSFFYFGSYWNQFPAFLAEHGFQVYHLHPPWKNKNRIEFLRTWIETQAHQKKKYHIFCDQKTLELIHQIKADYLNFENVILSLQEPQILQASRSQDYGLDFILFKINFLLHQIFTKQSLDLRKLGLAPKNLQSTFAPLLTQVRFLAEKDFSS